jgi:hypothetical protein
MAGALFAATMEKVMADNLKDRGPQDRARVNVEEGYERQWWAKKWGISEDKLREAVKSAGASAGAVASYLGKSDA